MKVAIIGASAIALEAALKFDELGAAVVWFATPSPMAEECLGPGIHRAWGTSALGLQRLSEAQKQYSTQEEFVFTQWMENYYLPLLSHLSNQHKVLPHEVTCISKRFLAPMETIAGSSRFADLFRIIFRVEPQAFIEQQRMERPETYERLTTELVESLQQHLEMYEDVDLVLDFRQAWSQSSLSVTGRALGEKSTPSDHIKCGLAALKFCQDLNPSDPEVREMALVGSGVFAAHLLLTLASWLKDSRNRLFVISHESWPFAGLEQLGDEELVRAVKQLLQAMEDEHQSAINDFHNELRQWQELDDFIRVKKTKPVEPIPRLVFFSGHNVSAVDQLIDKRRLFLTLEKPDFRAGEKQPENNFPDLKTIGVDRALGAIPNSFRQSERYLAPFEVGYFSLPLEMYPGPRWWQQQQNILQGIQDEVFKLFSRADAH